MFSQLKVAIPCHWKHPLVLELQRVGRSLGLWSLSHAAAPVTWDEGVP